jgi:hypothetical protein
MPQMRRQKRPLTICSATASWSPHGSIKHRCNSTSHRAESQQPRRGATPISGTRSGQGDLAQPPRQRPGRFGHPLGGHGISVSTSAGYNFALGNDWFIEPSARFIWSNTSIDKFNFGGVNGIGIGGTFATNDITREIGRLSARLGTTIIIWQPFASASVFHEFAGNVTASGL